MTIDFLGNTDALLASTDAADRLVGAKLGLIRALDLAYEISLDAIDRLLPEPYLFGRGKWRRRRNAARVILRREHGHRWRGIVVAADHDALMAAIGYPAGPLETARRAIAEASR